MRYAKLTAIALISIAVLILIAVLLGSSNAESDVEISLKGTSNSLHGSVIVLALSNCGATTLRLEPYCTLYWTNRAGASTDRIFQHDQPYAMLSPGNGVLVNLSSPPDAEIWDSSFGFAVKPRLTTRIIKTIQFCLTGESTPDNSCVVFLAPAITNSPSSTGKGDSP